MTNTGVVLEGLDGFAYMQLISRKAALKMEIAGMKRRGRSAYSICKSEYDLTGSREKVLAQMVALVEKAIADRKAEIAK